MPKYKDIPLTNATRVSRRHARDISPPGMTVLQNGYLSRSDNTPQVRPKLTPISDTLVSIAGTSDENDESDYLNSFFYSWVKGVGFYLTKYGPLYADNQSSEALYNTYDAGGVSCANSSTRVVEFDGEDVDLVVNVWPGCLLLYGGDYYTFEKIIDASTALLETSPGTVSSGSCSVIRIHNPDTAVYPFSISQYGSNIVYATPTYKPPSDVSAISGPFYMPLNEFVGASPWNALAVSTSFAPNVEEFAAPWFLHNSIVFDASAQTRGATPIIFKSKNNWYVVGSNAKYLAPAYSTLNGSVAVSYVDLELDVGGADVVANATSMAYADQLSAGGCAFWIGQSSGDTVEIVIDAAGGVGNAQHFMTFASDYKTVYANSGDRSRVNKIRYIGQMTWDVDTTWAVCDSGIIVADITNDVEIDLGSIGDLYDIASSVDLDEDGDIVVVGAGGVVYYIPAETDPTTAGNWTAATSGISNDLNWVYYLRYQDKFVAVSRFGDVLLSDDKTGSAWTAKTTPATGEAILDCIPDEEGRVVLFVCTDGKAYATTDLANYTDVTPDTIGDESLLSCTYAIRERKFIVGGTNGYIEDVRIRHYLKTFTSTSVSGPVAGIIAMTYFGSVFIGAFTDGTIKTSPGGASPWVWTTRKTFGSIKQAAFAVKSGTRAVLVFGGDVDGDRGVYSTDSTNGTTWDDAVEISGSSSESYVQRECLYDSVSDLFLTRVAGTIYTSSAGAAWSDSGISGVWLIICAGEFADLSNQAYSVIVLANGLYGVLSWGGSSYSLESCTASTTRIDICDNWSYGNLHVGSGVLQGTHNASSVTINLSQSVVAQDTIYAGASLNSTPYTGTGSIVQPVIDSSNNAIYAHASYTKVYVFSSYRAGLFTEADSYIDMVNQSIDEAVLISDGSDYYIYLRTYLSDLGYVYKLSSIVWGMKVGEA